MTDVTATYSPEDNKLRLYPSTRLDQETFLRVKAAGYRWAPRQELFVAPKWSCDREDLALELAGEIEPEEMTVAERAQAKAARLDELAGKREQQATAFSRAARDLAQRFEMGQPILVGHHSERKARKDKERMDTAQRKAVAAQEAASYWLYRAEGVERHANQKNDPKTRRNRIKGLLAELRDLQRTLNNAHKALATWETITTPDQIIKFLNYSDLAFAAYGTWSKVIDGKLDAQEARCQCMERCRATLNSDKLRRWINHTLNRLSYEREMLGDVQRYEGEITPTLLQMFVREHGADKPKGTKIDDDLFTIECGAPLPAHIAMGHSVELSGDEWRDLMEACGYVPPAKKAAMPPILNFKAPGSQIVVQSRATYRGAEPTETLHQIELTKAEYAAIPSDYKGTRLSACGEFRIRYGRNPSAKEPSWRSNWVAFVITNQKQHPVPEALKMQEAAE